MWMMPSLPALLLVFDARAEIDEKCAELPRPDDYDEQVQQDFLQNYVALAATNSPIHGPVPHDPGHGSIGVDLAVIPPLGCARRYVLNWTKTEDPNKTPVLPKPRVSFALKMPNEAVVPYASVGYVPPVRVFGTRNVLLAGEVGVGFRPKGAAQVGVRFHATSLKVVADVATAFDPQTEPAVDDLYLASTFGFDALVGYGIGPVVPYAAVGYTDASTYFFVGDDGIVSNNLHPYAGLAFSLGLDGLVGDVLRAGAELYAAPGGYSLPDDTVDSVGKGARYGHLYTGRVRLGVEM